jgi:hypothetical protein
MKPTFRQRLRYQFDNLMSRGTPALIGALFVLSLIIVLVAGAVISLPKKSERVTLNRKTRSSSSQKVSSNGRSKRIALFCHELRESQAPTRDLLGKSGGVARISQQFVKIRVISRRRF